MGACWVRASASRLAKTCRKHRTQVSDSSPAAQNDIGERVSFPLEGGHIGPPLHLYLIPASRRTGATKNLASLASWRFHQQRPLCLCVPVLTFHASRPRVATSNGCGWRISISSL